MLPGIFPCELVIRSCHVMHLNTANNIKYGVTGVECVFCNLFFYGLGFRVIGQLCAMNVFSVFNIETKLVTCMKITCFFNNHVIDGDSESRVMSLCVFSNIADKAAMVYNDIYLDKIVSRVFFLIKHLFEFIFKHTERCVLSVKFC